MARGDDALSRFTDARDTFERVAQWAARNRLDLREDRRGGWGAVFSPCGRWRYLLWRIDEGSGPILGAGLLNPSTADEARDDPTIRRCRSFAARSDMPGC